MTVALYVGETWHRRFAPRPHEFRYRLFQLLVAALVVPAQIGTLPLFLMLKGMGLVNTYAGALVPWLASIFGLFLVRQYALSIPDEMLEAARMDGASLWNEILHVLTPMAVPGIASTLLLNVILAWNESFWTILLTTTNAAPLTAFIASFSSPQGLFWAKLSAASTLAIAPILIMGWFSQRQLVRGLTFGAVK